MSDTSGRAGSTTRALREFLATEAAGGLLLVVATVVALGWANSQWHGGYETLWHTELSFHIGRFGIADDLRHWVDDGLMAIFFLVVGLEVKREFLLGELRERRKAALPVIAAVGGMVVPALIYLALNTSSPASRGWGIPMATDIAFAIGVLALIARSAPPGVRLFLLTLAIVDDIGAIVVIALFYSDGVSAAWLLAAFGFACAVPVLRRLGVTATPVFVVVGVGLWLALRAAGVHPTLAGVVMGLMVPATPALTREIVRSRADELLDVFSPKTARQTTRMARQSVSQLEWLEHELHGWSSFVIVPVFALANAGVRLDAEVIRDAATSSVTIGVLLGLVVGKTAGISIAAWLATRFGVAELPEDVAWRQLVGAAALGGIGFTVSLFISGLAFDGVAITREAKIGVIASSIIAAILGSALLRMRSKEATPA